MIRVLLLSVLCCSISYAEEIPLSAIWALDMPGTKDLSSIQDKKPAGYTGPSRKRILDRARRTLFSKLPETQARSGFAVSGHDRVALSRVSNALYSRESQEWQRLISSEDVSLGFFSYSCGYDNHIEGVERHGNTFRIKYRFIPQYKPEPTVQLALIPVGKLTAGRYQVEIIQSTIEQQYLNAGFMNISEEMRKRLVCQPYSFEVYDPPTPDPGIGEDTAIIPLDQIFALNMPGTRDVHELDLNKLSQPLQTLRTGPLSALLLLEKDSAGPGFVVRGEGQEALIAAHEKLAPGEMPPNTLPSNSKVSVVYYSHAYAPRIVLQRVERQGTTINIRYRYDGTGDTSFSSHFALIPLGELSPGEYRVNIIDSLDDLYQESPIHYQNVVDDIQRAVCKSFEFSIAPEKNGNF